MSQYYRNSGLTWQQYLQAQAFVDDIKDGIHSIVASNEALGEGISAGLDQLDSTLQSGFDQANETLCNGFERMEYGLDKIAGGIAGLRSDFNWAMSEILHKLDIQNLLLKDIYVELRIPDFQKERRYYVEQGCKHYTNGLYQESLDNFLKAEPLEKTDPFVLYSIGQMYLYQPDMIDMDKAQDYFIRAGKYYVAENKNKEAGQSYFHAGIAAYLRRDDVNAPQFAKKASELYPELLEAFYNYAKFLAVQGNDSGLLSLELAIRKDRNYALKVTADSDFASFSAQWQGLLDKLKREAKTEAEKAIADMERELDEYVIVEETVKKEINNLLNSNKVRDLIAKDTYFDYLDCASVVQSMQRELKEILYSPITPMTIYSIWQARLGAVVCGIVFWSSDLILAIILEGEKARLFDVLKNNLLHTMGVGADTVFSSDGLILAYPDDSFNEAMFREVKTGKILCTSTFRVSGSLRKIAFSPVSNVIACAFREVGSDNAIICLLDVQTRRELKLKYISASLAFSPDGLILASGGNKTLKLWDVKLGKEIRTLEGHSGWVNSVAFSHNGLILASGSGDGTIKLWNTQTCKELRTLKGHSDSISRVVFSPNDSSLASGSTDKTVRLWGVQTGKELYTITGHTEMIFSVAFSPDGLTLVSGDYGGAVKLWKLEWKAMPKTQWKYQEEKRREDARRKAEQKQREDEERIAEEYLRQQKDEERIAEEHLHRSDQWRSEGRCEVCGEPIGFSFTRKTRCKKHQQ